MGDDVTEDCRQLITSSLEAIKAQVVKKQARKIGSGEELNQGLADVESKYYAATEKIFEKTTSYLCAHVLTVPKNVVLQEDAAGTSGEVESVVVGRLNEDHREMAALKARIEENIVRGRCFEGISVRWSKCA